MRRPPRPAAESRWPPRPWGSARGLADSKSGCAWAGAAPRSPLPAAVAAGRAAPAAAAPGTQVRPGRSPPLRRRRRLGWGLRRGRSGERWVPGRGGSAAGSCRAARGRRARVGPPGPAATAGPRRRLSAPARAPSGAGLAGLPRPVPASRCCAAWRAVSQPRKAVLASGAPGFDLKRRFWRSWLRFLGSKREARLSRPPGSVGCPGESALVSLK